jgi:hypothetical protein
MEERHNCKHEKQPQSSNKGDTMKVWTIRMFSAAMLISLFALTPSLSLAKQGDKPKVKPTKKETKDNSGRQAGELPSGLEKHIEKKGQLPSGLQKMKDEDGSLTKGLEKGGKKLSSTKGNKPVK